MEILRKLGDEVKGLSFLKRERRDCTCDNSHPHNAFVKSKCVPKNADQEKNTVHAFEAETIGVQFILCLRLSGTCPHAPPPPQICAYEGKSDRERGREEEENQAEKKRKKPCLCALLPTRRSFIT